MIRDRMPDLLALAQSEPDVYNEPEAHPDVPLDSKLKIMFERAEKVTKYLSEMKTMMSELNTLHDKVFTSASYQQEQECREKISNLGNRFSAIARKLKAVLKRIDVPEDYMQSFSAIERVPPAEPRSSRDDIDVEQPEPSKELRVTWHRLSSGLMLPLSSSSYIPAETRMRFHLHNILNYKLTCLVRDYYTMQKLYGDRCREKIDRQMSIIGRQMDENEIERAIHRGEQVPLLHGEIMDDALVDQEMQARLREVETLHKEVLNLEKGIQELHKAFLTISTLIYEQGAIVDRIEQHISISSDYVDNSKQMLKKASSFQHKYRKKKVIIAFIILLALLIIIVIIVVTVEKRKTKTTKVIIKHEAYKADDDYQHLSGNEFFDNLDEILPNYDPT